MEQKLNIAEILKNKPRGTKLYSMIHGKCSSEAITDEIFKIHFCTSKFGLMQAGECTLIKFGNMFDDGECVIFPSKEMQDWSKFAWNTGDILVNKDGNAHVIFEGFDDDTYETFNGNNYLWENEGITMCFGEYEVELPTSDFSKANKEDAQKYIRQIEKRLGYKLNFETLEIEKSEFKDGDIAFADFGNTQDVFIVSGKTNLSEGYYSFIALNLNSTKALNIGYKKSFFKENLSTIRLATEEEKQQLFDALAKEGKAWDAEKKQIVDLKPKCEFKPFDRCIWKIRNCEGSIWKASFVSYVDEYGATPMDMSIDEDLVNLIILPYNDQTKLLVGTTDEWEGGEHD